MNGAATQTLNEYALSVLTQSRATISTQLPNFTDLANKFDILIAATRAAIDPTCRDSLCFLNFKFILYLILATTSATTKGEQSFLKLLDHLLTLISFQHLHLPVIDYQAISASKQKVFFLLAQPIPTETEKNVVTQLIGVLNGIRAALPTDPNVTAALQSVLLESFRIITPGKLFRLILH